LKKNRDGLKREQQEEVPVTINLNRKISMPRKLINPKKNNTAQNTNKGKTGFKKVLFSIGMNVNKSKLNLSFLQGSEDRKINF
jgi:hypothetical protein